MDNQKQGFNVVDTGSHGLKKKKMSTWSVVCMIFCLVAAGAFGIEEIIPDSGPGLTLIMLMVLPFIWSTPFALVASELGAARPQEGGYYKWVQEALGEYWGFQAGWWRTVSIHIDNTLYIILAGNYVAGYFNLSPMVETAIKFTMIIIFTYINIRGIRDVGIVSTILSVLVLIAFLMVTICGLMNWQHNPFVPLTAAGDVPITDISAGDWIYYVGMGIALGMWMYSGYESMSTVAGEVENPQVIPKATMISVPLIMLAYLLPTFAGLACLGDWDKWGTDVGSQGYATVLETYWGPAFGVFFVVIAVLSNSSIYNTYIASGSRGFFALADDHLAPPILVKCDKKYGVPYVAVLTIAITNMILCQFAFTTIVVIDTFLFISAYILVFISAIILRKKMPDEERKFKIPGGYGFLKVLCIVPICLGFFAFFVNGTDYFIGGMIGIISGPIAYIFIKKRYKGLAMKDPVRFPVNSKTGLAVGDIRRIAITFLVFAVIGAAAWPWLMWFEGPWWGQWGPEYYKDTYESGLLSDFNAMLTAIKIATIIFAVVALICFIMASKIEPKENSV